jgi:ATP-dependent Clp protease ATP-binding subunit ClpA
MTPRLHKVVALARKEATAMEHNYVSPEHVLLGLLREGEGIAYKILNAHGVTLESVRQHCTLDEREKESIIQERAAAIAKLSDRDRELLGLPRIP